MFNPFKKKKEKKQELYYDPSNVRITTLVKGSFLDYDFKTWEVKDAFEYDWGNGYKAKEFQLETGDELIFLYVDENQGLECSVSEKVNIYDIDENAGNTKKLGFQTNSGRGSGEGDIIAYIMNNANETPPMKVSYKGEQYFRSSEEIGYSRVMGEKDWDQLISWSYYDSEQKKTLTIERWGEEDFSAALGNVVEEYEFSNIIMP